MTIPSNNITEHSVYEILKRNYLNFGKYANETRGNFGLDGLKAVQRRVLMSVRECDNGKSIGSSQIVSHCLNNLHPHGDQSIYDTLVRLVQKGFVIPNANFGNIDAFDPSDSAAYRYTSVKAHKQFTDGVFRFIDLVDHVENEYGFMEPKLLPVPIPLVLTTGGVAIGFGTSSFMPFFSAKSLFSALHADDPSLLKAPAGLVIMGGDLNKLWTTNSGFLMYGYRCFKQSSDLDGKDISIIEGPGRYFPTRISDTFGKLEEEGSVWIRDESTNKTRVAISRVKNIKRISDEEVHNLALEASVSQLMFRTNIVERSPEDGVTKKVSIQAWTQKLWNSYSDTVDRYKLDKVKKLEKQIEILNLIPKIQPLINPKKKPNVHDISSKLNIDIAIARDILSKPISMFLEDELEKKINAHKDEIELIKKLNAKVLAQDIVNVLEKAQTI